MTETQTPTYPFPTFDSSFVFRASTKNEFERSDSILFSSGPGVEYKMDIYDINADGVGFECITCETRQYLEERGMISPLFKSPSWSPDGSMYAYVFLSDQKDYILVRGVDMGQDIKLISGQYNWYDSLSWSPDGKHIAFSEYNHEEENNIICYIKVNLQQSETENKICISPGKISNLPAWNPSWSPDGKNIIFSVGNSLFIPSGQPTDLYQWDITSENISRITETPVFEILPKWSPDGAKFAFIQVEGVIPEWHYSLWIMNADGTGRNKIEEEANILDFGWSPDGKKIIYIIESTIKNVSCDAGCLPFTVIKILYLGTGKTEALSDGEEWIGYPSWRPDT